MDKHRHFYDSLLIFWQVGQAGKALIQYSTVNLQCSTYIRTELDKPTTVDQGDPVLWEGEIIHSGCSITKLHMSRKEVRCNSKCARNMQYRFRRAPTGLLIDTCKTHAEKTGSLGYRLGVGQGYKSRSREKKAALVITVYREHRDHIAMRSQQYKPGMHSTWELEWKPKQTRKEPTYLPWEDRSHMDTWEFNKGGVGWGGTQREQRGEQPHKVSYLGQVSNGSKLWVKLWVKAMGQSYGSKLGSIYQMGQVSVSS